MKEISPNGLPFRPFKGIKPKEEYKTQILYNLNEETNELYEVGQKNVEEEIQSHFGSSLDYILDRFLNHGEEPQINVESAKLHQLDSKLDLAEKFYTMREMCVQELGLAANASTQQVIDCLKNAHAAQKQKLKETLGGNNNETPIEETKSE